jgi:hypothetical protein
MANADAYVDIDHAVVRAGDASWSFDLDCRTGSVSITMDDTRYIVRTMLWREKMILARFAHLGASFVRRQFLRLALEPGVQPPADERQYAGLLALAMWLNNPYGSTVDLRPDLAQLATVALEVCKASGLKLADLDGLAAINVETLWSAVSQPEPSASIYGDLASNEPHAWDDAADTRIIVVPAPEESESARHDESPTPHDSASLEDVDVHDDATGSSGPDALDETPQRPFEHHSELAPLAHDGSTAPSRAAPPAKRIISDRPHESERRSALHRFQVCTPEAEGTLLENTPEAINRVGLEKRTASDENGASHIPRRANAERRSAASELARPGARQRTVPAITEPQPRRLNSHGSHFDPVADRHFREIAVIEALERRLTDVSVFEMPSPQVHDLGPHDILDAYTRDRLFRDLGDRLARAAEEMGIDIDR